jgi:hypothetical protein
MPRWNRPLARGLSLFLVAFQLLGIAHLVVERHGVCWEHGTVTELQPGEVGTPLTGPVSPEETGIRSGQSTARLDDVDGHRHCPVQASRRDWSSPPASGLLIQLAGPGPAGDALCAALPRADAALLLRAPKQSPPSAA